MSALRQRVRLEPRHEIFRVERILRSESGSMPKRQNKIINDAWEIARQEAHAALPRILSPVQIRLLPGNANMLYRAAEPLTMIRYFSTAAC